MEQNIEYLVTCIHNLEPFLSRSEIRMLVTRISQQDHSKELNILNHLYDDLKNGIPFSHTFVGKYRTLTR